MFFLFSVKEDTLTDMVSAMKENVGLVHQMPYVCDRKGFAGVLEKVRPSTTFTVHHKQMEIQILLFVMST